MRQDELPSNLIARDNPLPVGVQKIITVPGVRRCGKSSKMEIVANDLINRGLEKTKILWISFDDERLVKMTSDELNLIIEAYRELFPAVEMSEVYMFFDEIQLIDGWEYFVMRLYKHYTKNIYISGSNTTLLSTELKSALRGWPIEEETMPLSFREYCIFKGIEADSWREQDIAIKRNIFLEYNKQGGFPEIVLTEQQLLKVKILQGYFDAMLFRDMVEHYKVSNIEVLRYFIKRIMINLTKPTSIRAIHNDLKSRGLKVSKDDLYLWADYACNIFMFLRIPCYSRSLQVSENSQLKYYCIDNGLRDAVILPQSEDSGKKLENSVFLELYRRRQPMDKIYYYSGKNECDFVIQRGVDIVQLVQVCWNLSDEATRKREIDGIIEASKFTGCKNLCIVTFDEREEIKMSTGEQITVLPAWQWALNM